MLCSLEAWLFNPTENPELSLCLSLTTRAFPSLLLAEERALLQCEKRIPRFHTVYARNKSGESTPPKTQAGLC